MSKKVTLVYGGEVDVEVTINKYFAMGFLKDVQHKETVALSYEFALNMLSNDALYFDPRLAVLIIPALKVLMDFDYNNKLNLIQTTTHGILNRLSMDYSKYEGILFDSETREEAKFLADFIKDEQSNG